MKIIAFGTLKGGTGKTTVAFNVGGLLAEKYKVLFIFLSSDFAIREYDWSSFPQEAKGDRIAALS